MAHVVPTAADLIARYPAFADVPTATIDVHIADAAATAVDTSWSEASYAPAIAAFAAHRMTLLDIGVHGDVAGFLGKGVTRIRTGNFDASFSEGRVAATSSGALDATRYGQEYKRLLKMEKGGPRVVPAGAGVGDFGHIYQRNDGTYTPWGF